MTFRRRARATAAVISMVTAAVATTFATASTAQAAGPHEGCG